MDNKLRLILKLIDLKDELIEAGEDKMGDKLLLIIRDLEMERGKVLEDENSSYKEEIEDKNSSYAKMWMGEI